MAMGGGGGAWKVAFADFMTAMMALFLVLWISAQDQKILIATSKYFQSPFSSPMTEHSGIMPFNKSSTSSSSSSESSESQSSSSSSSSASDSTKQIKLQFLNSVAADFTRMLNIDQVADQSPVDIQVTADGLRVTLFDRPKQPVFEGDTDKFTEFGENLMQSLSWMIERHHFRVVIDGHTRAGMKWTQPDQSSWELSTARANSTRRRLVHYAVSPEQIDRVTGYGDTVPLDGEKPDSIANHRVALSLSMKTKKEEAAEIAEAKAAEKKNSKPKSDKPEPRILFIPAK